MRVGIVRFGIGGGGLAVALAQDGHDVTVFEQTDAPGPVGAGFLCARSWSTCCRVVAEPEQG